MQSKKSPRSKEDFDAWFSKGDPWGYDNGFVIERQHNSLTFIEKFYPKNYEGNIIEFGAFNGDFTKLLLTAYPHALVFSNDISEIAVSLIKQKTSSFKHITCICSDMLSFDFTCIKNKNNSVVTLMECLYYMNREEQKEFITNLARALPSAGIFVSTPIIGDKYYLEDELLYLFKETGYFCESICVLNFQKPVRLTRLLIWICNKVPLIRRRIAHQVIYYFKPS